MWDKKADVWSYVIEQTKWIILKGLVPTSCNMLTWHSVLSKLFAMVAVNQLWNCWVNVYILATFQVLRRQGPCLAFFPSENSAPTTVSCTVKMEDGW